MPWHFRMKKINAKNCQAHPNQKYLYKHKHIQNDETLEFERPEGPPNSSIYIYSAQ